MSFHKSGRNDTENPGGSVNPVKETMLGDYINRKLRHEAFEAVNNEKKLTFEEWYSQSGWAPRVKPITLDPESLERIIRSTWKAAQENV